jgi:hypothetical protein
VPDFALDLIVVVLVHAIGTLPRPWIRERRRRS